MAYLKKSFEICSDYGHNFGHRLVVEEVNSNHIQIQYVSIKGETSSFRIEKKMIPLLVKALEEMIKD